MTPRPGEQPHRRFNPLTGEWLLVSPHRTLRPWQGQEEARARRDRPPYDAACYLCPGNRRSGGQRNPDYEDTFVFDNDFPALLPDAGRRPAEAGPLFRSEPESGVCRVVCFSPRHDLSVAGMPLHDVAKVVRLWAEEYLNFKSLPGIGYAQIFENKGEMMGCSNPHPHCQIWASSTLPNIAAREDRAQRDYLGEHGVPMLVEYGAKEAEARERIVHENRHFLVLVPYWAVWPFEVMILPKQHRPSLDALGPDETAGLAEAYGTITRVYDRLFDCEFPYTAGIHQAPTTDRDHSAWQLHMHFYPPLLRSATVRKFMVGYEMLATPQRDLTPETAAELLRKAGASPGDDGSR